MYEEFPYRPYSGWRKNISVRVEIDPQVINRPNGYAEAIILAIENGKPFILFYDDSQFMLAITQFNVVICFSDGIPQTNEAMPTIEKFVDRVKLGMIVYDKFSTVDDWYRKFPAIENIYLLSK